MNIIKRFSFTLAFVAAVFSLGACGVSEEPDLTPEEKAALNEEEAQADQEWYEEDLHEVEFTLKDGRKVTCIVFDGVKKGGLDCLEGEIEKR